jgi:hypothetical protein
MCIRCGTMKTFLRPGLLLPAGHGTSSFPSACGHRPATTRTKLVLPVAFLPVTMSALSCVISQLTAVAIASPRGVTRSTPSSRIFASTERSVPSPVMCTPPASGHASCR